MTSTALPPWRLDVLRSPNGSAFHSRSDACARFFRVVRDDASWDHAWKHHALLLESLRLHCLKSWPRFEPRQKSGGRWRYEPETPTLIDTPPFAWGALRSVVDVRLSADAPAESLFQPLFRPRRSGAVERRGDLGNRVSTPIVLAPASVCKLVLADMSRVAYNFVLLGPWTAGRGSALNFGALPRGYDHGCAAVGGSTQLFSACMLEDHFRRHCPSASLQHVLRFLNHPRLIAWFIHHVRQGAHCRTPPHSLWPRSHGRD